MKNYNGSQPSSVQSPQQSQLRSPQNSQSRSNLKPGSPTAFEFSIQEVKNDYNRTSGPSDKHKAEQTNLKSALKQSLDQKLDMNSYEDNTPKQRDLSSRHKSKSSRDNEQLVWELEEENQELKGQLEAALARITKLHRDKQALQERNSTAESQTQNKELVNEIKSLNQEIKSLTAQLQELEDDNIKLLKQKEKAQSKALPKPSQSLLRYINYVFKLISSMSHTTFARTCFEERFPRDTNIAELLESGDFEGVLLKSFKYITDLLINLNSLSTEEHHYKAPETPLSLTAQYNEHYSSRMVSPRSGKSVAIDETFRNKQNSQEESFEAQSEPVSALKSPKRSDFQEHKSSKKVSQDLEQTRGALLKITGVPEEDDSYIKHKKSHSRHYSSTAGLSRLESNDIEEERDVTTTSSRMKKNGSQESKHGGNSNTTGVSRHDEENFTSIVYGKRKGNESVPNEGEMTERHSSYKNKVVIEEKEREVKEYKSPRQEKVPIEEQYRSKYARSKQSNTKGEKDEVESRREDEQSEKKGYGRKSKTPKASKEYRREIQFEPHSRSLSRERDSSQDTTIDVNSIAYRDRNEQSRYINKGIMSPRKNTAEYEKRIEQGIREVTHESEDNISEHHSRREKKKNRDSQSKLQVTELEDLDDNEDTRDKQEMWDRKRQELARLSRKMSSHVETEAKGKGYSTFRVSFGRTESKHKASMSPNSRGYAGISEGPKKKKLERGASGVGLAMTPKSNRNADGEKTIRFALDDEPKKSLGKKKSNKDLRKSFSNAVDNDGTPKRR